MSSIILRDRPPVAGVILLAVALLVVGAAGCSQNRSYSINNIPKQFLTRPVTNPPMLDLSPFAGPSVDPELIDVGDKVLLLIAAGMDPEDQTSVSVRVGEDGTAWLPEIGQVSLVGLPPMAAERRIVTIAMERNIYRQPSVTASIASRRTNTITVMGAVNRSAVVAGVRQDTTHDIPWRSAYLKEAIDSAGGLSASAGTKVWIWRPVTIPGEPQTLEIDLTDPEDRKRGSPYLPHGSVVTVDERPPRIVLVEGLVTKPGSVEYPIVHGLRLNEAIGMAGGWSSPVVNSVVVTRLSADGLEKCDIVLSVDDPAHQNFELMPGDLVRVKQTPLTWALFIVQNVLRFNVGASTAIW